MSRKYSEKYVESSSSKRMIKLGWIAIKLMKLSKNGYPDHMFLKDGKTVFIEYKATGKKPSPLQMLRIEQLQEAGFTATWTDDPFFVITM